MSPLILAFGAFLFQQPDPGLVLARVCVREAGFRAHRTGDCSGIWTVLDRVGRGDVIRGAELYAHGTRDLTGRRPWVPNLGARPGAPSGWPKALDWKGYERDWRALLAYARRLVAERPIIACRPHHWGDRHGDRVRAEGAGMSLVNCGATRNLFWRRGRP
jgi:hypothetical protein